MTGEFLGEASARLRGRVAQVVTGRRPDLGGGAGIAWPGTGLLVTNAHVATAARVTVVTPDGRGAPGEVLRRDPHRDLALVRAPKAALQPVEVADPASLRPGALVLAVGHPFGIRQAVSAGIFQATGPLPPGLQLPGSRGNLPWVQADVRLAPGNSGGPVADAAGRVIGVAAMILAGLALAIPSPDVEALVASVAPGPRLGLTAHAVALPELHSMGLALDEVEPGMPAARAGLATGDVLVAAGGRPLQSTSDLAWAIRHGSGEWLTLDLLRGGTWRRHEVALRRSAA